MVDPRLEEYLDLPHVGPEDIQSETGRLLPTMTAREDGLVSGKFLFDEGHVLYSKIRPYLRKVALPAFRGLCSADVYPLTPDTNQVNREYLWALLLSDYFTRYAAGLGERSSIPKVNRDQLNAFSFPVPPLSLQHEFAGLVKNIRALEDEQGKSRERLGGFFQSILYRAFAGEL
jgi:type I restriction enzyme S subunit